MYIDPEVYVHLGKEVCIALDIVLAAGGCEAIVEGFYSVVGAHKKNDGQGNATLIQRSIVDWYILSPISCPRTMREISHLYLNGDESFGLKKHRNPNFFDPRQRTNYVVGNVVVRLANEKRRCPHVICDE